MYYYLSGALKRRLILELQDSFSRHPIYRKIVPYIQNKHAFEERPQFGIIVQNSSANKLQLDPSNFIGTVRSHVMLAQLPGIPVFPLEWVREDLQCLRNNGGNMPTEPGVYYLEILSAPTNPNEAGSFVIDPLKTVTNEPVIHFQSGLEMEGQLQNVPVAKTLRLYLGRGRALIEGEDYELLEQGALRFLHNFPSDCIITADYRYAADSIGPVNFKWNTSDSTTLPGVVLAFGKRSETGQKIAVVVYGDRVDAAQAHGGKNEVSLELEVVARDTVQLEEISDLVNIMMWGEKRPILAWEGIEVIDVSQGGEGEEPIDETGQNFTYTSTVSIQLRADWEIHIPMPLTISKLEPAVNAVASTLFYETFPVVVGRNPDYERIG